MHHHYADIRKRIAEPPVWFDERAVPRYAPFSPHDSADVYASEVVLLEVACQNCGALFAVAMSWSPWQWVHYRRPPLSRLIRAGAIRFGDPPNVGCCGAGPTMNSVARRVLEYWRQASFARDLHFAFTRVPALETAIESRASSGVADV